LLKEPDQGLKIIDITALTALHVLDVSSPYAEFIRVERHGLAPNTNEKRGSLG